jgi:hypothetical protein
VKDTSLLHLLHILQRIVISVEICICLLFWLSHSKFTESYNPQRDNKHTNNLNPPTLGHQTPPLEVPLILKAMVKLSSTPVSFLAAGEMCTAEL